MKIMCNIGLMA